MRRLIVTFGLSFLCLGPAACGDDDSTPADAGSKRDAAVSDAGRVTDGGREADAASAIDAIDAGSDSLGPVQLEFKAVVGSEPFACGHTYKGVGSTGLAVTPVDFRFFVQDVKLIRSSGEEVDVAIRRRASNQDDGVALVDFIDGKGACVGDAMTNVEVTGNAPIGDYDGVVFSVGVPEALNHQNIVLANPPLQDTSLYWGWLNGYRFLLAQLEVPGLSVDDGDDDDAGVVGRTSSLIHIGSEACGGSNKLGYSCNRANRSRVRLTGFDPRRRAIVVDLAAIFANIDLRTAKQCHGAEAGCESIFEALGVSFETGEPLEMQSVFRPE